MKEPRLKPKTQSATRTRVPEWFRELPWIREADFMKEQIGT